MITLLKRSSAVHPLVFFMADLVDRSGKTGLTPTVYLAKDGGAFALAAGAVSEIGFGLYKVAPNATDTNTLGSLVLTAFAAGAEQAMIPFGIVAYDPDLISMGLVLLKNTNITNFNDIAATDIVSAGAIGTLGGSVLNVTTLANHTPQSGDAFARLGANGAGLTAVAQSSVWTPAIAARIDQNISAAGTLTAGERTSIATEVWSTATRTLTAFGTLAADVWASPTRTLSAFGFTVAPTAAQNATAVWANATRTLTAFGFNADYATQVQLNNATVNILGNLPGPPPSAAENAFNVWNYATRALTAFNFAVAPTAGEIANAVWGAATRTLTAAAGGATAAEVWNYATRTLTSGGGSATDPLASLVPGVYAEGTAGKALGRLLLSYPDTPIHIVPGPGPESNMCRVYADIETPLGELVSKVDISIELVTEGPIESERLIYGRTTKIKTATAGRIEFDLQRNDLMEPETSWYEITSKELGFDAQKFILTTDVFNLADIGG